MPRLSDESGHFVLCVVLLIGNGLCHLRVAFLFGDSNGKQSEEYLLSRGLRQVVGCTWHVRGACQAEAKAVGFTAWVGTSTRIHVPLAEGTNHVPSASSTLQTS